MDKSTRRLHALCLPSPAQSHIGAMLKLAKLLHHMGFSITFVNTEFNHRRLIKVGTGGSAFLDNLPPDFHFVSIPDGIPPSESDGTQDLKIMFDSVMYNLTAPVSSLVQDLNERSASEPAIPPVSCIVADGFMSFSACPAGEKFGIPVVSLYTISACSLMGFMHFSKLMKEGYIPLKDESYLTNGYLNTTIDWIPGMNGIRLCDLPSFIRTTEPDDIFLNFIIQATEKACNSTLTIIHTFEALESDVLSALSQMLPGPVFSIGPLQLFLDRILEHEYTTKHIKCNLWEEDMECLEWLNLQKPESVLYVNFGSVVFLTPEQLVELAMGLTRSEHPFLWIIRSDLVSGETAVLPPEFVEETGGRGFISSWCPQEEVLNHPATGGFLTHCGWNSIIESLSAGVPMLCWASLGDQPTNCKYVCTEWKAGIEIQGEVKREGVERVVRQLLDEEKGKHMKKRAVEWRQLAMEATGENGTSSMNLDKLVNDIMKSLAK